jgi:hypothetical protein
MFFKISYLMPIFIASFLNLTPAATTSKISGEEPWNIQDAKIVASWPEENINLYALNWKREQEEQRGYIKR